MVSAGRDAVQLAAGPVGSGTYVLIDGAPAVIAVVADRLAANG
jgi:hypothetical protein